MNKDGVSGEKMMEDITEKREPRERGEYFWHTYYGFPSEMLGWVLLVVSLLYLVFVLSVAIGA